jgi:hypothetical protein
MLRTFTWTKAKGNKRPPIPTVSPVKKPKNPRIVAREFVPK